MSASVHAIERPQEGPMPPHSVELEQAVLGALLLAPERVADFQNLRDEDFFFALHRKVFVVLKKGFDRGLRVSGQAIAAHLAADEEFQEAGGLAYLQRLAEDAPGTRSTGDYARYLRELAVRRRLVTLFEAGSADALSGIFDQSAGEIVANAQRALSEIVTVEDEEPPAAIGTASEAVLSRRSVDRSDRIPTGLPSLDAMIGGLKRKAVTVLAGRTSMGKSTLATVIARHITMAGTGVFLRATEMNADQVAPRMISDHVRQKTGWKLPYSVITAKGADLPRRDMEHAASAAVDMASWPLLIEADKGTTVREIEMRARQAAKVLRQRGSNLGVVIIDHIGHLRAPEAKRNLTEHMAEVSNEMLGLAKRLDVAVIAVCQLNRDVESKERKDNRRPTMADLKHSGEIEQDAHCVILAYREEYYRAKGEPDRDVQPEAHALWLSKLEPVRNRIELIVDKNRDGETGTVHLRCYMNTATICEEELP